MRIPLYQIPAILTVLAAVPGIHISAQAALPLSFDAYVDAYYIHDSDPGSSGIRILSIAGPVEDQFRLNVVQLGVSGEYEGVRGRIALHEGDIREGYWNGSSNTPLIQEAWAGVRLSESIWLDAGYFLTHIGGEAMAPRDNFLSAHAVLTIIQPMYQAGVRVGYDVNENFRAELHVLNGYGIHDDDNVNKSVGVYLRYGGEHWSVSYANLLGNEGAGGSRAFQVYNNLQARLRVGTVLELLGQADVAFRDSPELQQDRSFIAGYLAAKIHFSTTVSIALRLESFGDNDGMFTANLWGSSYSAGMELKLNEHSYLRGEMRYLHVRRQGVPPDIEPLIFRNADGEPTEGRLETMLGIGVWF